MPLGALPLGLVTSFLGFPPLTLGMVSSEMLLMSPRLLRSGEGRPTIFPEASTTAAFLLERAAASFSVAARLCFLLPVPVSFASSPRCSVKG